MEKLFLPYLSVKRLAKIIIGFIAFYFASDLIIANQEKGIDFWGYYYAAKAFISNVNMYDVNILKGLSTSEYKEKIYPYLYPPLFAITISGLAFFKPVIAQKIWILSLCLCSAFVCVSGIILSEKYLKNFKLISDLSNRKFTFLFSAFLVVTLLFILPFRDNIELGQVNMFVLLFLIIALIFDNKKKFVFSGLFLSLSILIKVTPAILLIYFLFRKKYKTVSATFIFSILIFIATFLLDNGKSWMHFLAYLPETSYGSTIEGLTSPAHICVFSFSSFFMRLAIENILHIKIFTYMSVCLLLALLFLSFKRTDMPELCLLPLLILMIIASPYTYLHHIIYIFPGLIIFILAIYLKGSVFNKNILIAGILLITLLAGINFPKYYYLLSKSYLFKTFAEFLFHSLNLLFLLILFFYSLFIINIYFSIKHKIKINLK